MSAIRWGASVRCVVASMVLGSQTVVLAQDRDPSIRQQVHETGGFERISVTPYEPLPLAHLSTQAKLVVEASIADVRSYLDKTEMDVNTDYTLTVHAVISNRERSEVPIGEAITVRRKSGVIVVDGHSAEVYENGFPAFRAGERYILFLTREPRDIVYTVLGGNQGAFVAGKTITPIATASEQGVAQLALSRDKFLGEVRALLKFSQN